MFHLITATGAEREIENCSCMRKTQRSQKHCEGASCHKRKRWLPEGKEYLVSWCIGHLIELAKCGSSTGMTGKHGNMKHFP